MNLDSKINSFSFQESREINILEVGCGAGIFSFIVFLKNLFKLSNKEVDTKFEIDEININLYLSDIDPNSIISSFINFDKYKTLFINKFIKINNRIHKINLNSIKFYVDDLVKNFIENKIKYNNYFDYILANLPQTPSQESIRSRIYYYKI